MVSIASLWLPIVLSAVFVFILSSVIHMLLTYHRSDVSAVPQEDQVMSALRGFNIPPGDYMIPHAGTPDRMKAPEFQEKLTKGPIAVVTVLPTGPFSMGTSLVQWFVYCLVVSVFAAYVASRAVDPGETYLTVFRFAGVTAFSGYGLALAQNSIWWHRKWSSTLKSVFDALLFSLVTAGTFGWLWPN
jgi:hypothetical protein